VAGRDEEEPFPGPSVISRPASRYGQPAEESSMKYKTSVTGLLVLVLLLGSGIVFAQEQPASDAEAETEAPAEEFTTYGDYTVKAYSISLYGGYFSGDTFFELPPVDDERTFVEQGTNRVMGYDGEWLPLDPELWDAPRKTITSGYTVGGTIGVFLSDLFHFDLDFSYSKTTATTTPMATDPR
jgi:hypothetical protein